MKKQDKNKILPTNALKLNTSHIKLPIITTKGSFKNLKKWSATGFEYNNRVFALLGVNYTNTLRTISKIFTNRHVSTVPLFLIKNKKYQVLKRLLQRRWLFLKNNQFYKGLRYSKGLPIRGQRTHTNASTSRKFNYITN